MPDNRRQFTALATIAARTANAGSAGVLFNVMHFGARTPSSRPAPPTGIAPFTATDQLATESLAFHVAGVGFRVHTWSPEIPSVPSGEVSARRIPPRTPAVSDGGFARELYGGNVVSSPDFLYDSSHSTELLLTLSNGAWAPDYTDSLMIARTYHAMTTATAEAGVPILLLQSPVAPFREPGREFRGDGSGEAPRISKGMAVRMLVGLDESAPSRRLVLVRRITEFAAEHGLGLQVADRRFGRVRGEWWSVLRPDTDRYTERKATLFGWATPGIPRSVQLLTFVGPARVGSSAAIAADLVGRNMGILAMSSTLLQEIAFINLVVPIAPARHTRTATTTGTCLPISGGLGRAARDCGLTPRKEVRAKSTISDTTASAYLLLTTGPITPHHNGTDGIDRPLWLSWDLPLDPATPDVAQLVLRQLLDADRVSAAHVDYYRARVLPTHRVTGRAKISVTLIPGISTRDVPDVLSDLCPWAEREATSKLVRHGTPLRNITLTLAWRERWLSQTNPPA